MLRRVILFLDHANLFHNLEKFGRIRIDYAKFRDQLSRNYHLVGSFLYMGITPEIFPKKKAFMNYVESQGFVIQSRDIKVSPDGKKAQKGIDIYIYRDIIELAEADAYDKAVLVSGDSDFIDVIMKLQELHKDYEVWGFRESISNRLINIAGEYKVNYVDDILDLIKI